MGKMHFCGIHNYGGNLPCPACMGFQVGHAETYGSTRAECDALRSRVSNLSRLLTRCRSELQSVLADINADQIPHDGDDFHELLRDLNKALDPNPRSSTRSSLERITMEAIGFPDILAKEGTVLGLPIARSCDGRHCFALVTESQRKDRRAKKRSEKWERETLLWIAIPADNLELRHTVCRAHLEQGPFKAVYQDAFPLPVLESFQPTKQE